MMSATAASAKRPASLSCWLMRSGEVWEVKRLASRMTPETVRSSSGGYGEAHGWVEYGFWPSRNIRLFGMSALTRSEPPLLCWISR